MVRKRSRSSRKRYDDDDNDSDSDFALEAAPSEPAPKKYSLRQRKRRIFTEFEFDDEGDEIEPTKAPSDDDEFEVEKELELDEAPDSEYVDKTTYINTYEPDSEEIPEDAEGLIDFEDMIRADIVVNKNRIDYDNIIQKTEIKVQPIQGNQELQAFTQPAVKAKRGRKPKIRPEGEIDSSLLEPETEMLEAEYVDKDDKDYNPEDDLDDELIDCTKLVHTELSESVNGVDIVPNSVFTNESTNGVRDDDSLAEKNVTQEADVKVQPQVSTSESISETALETINEGSSPNVASEVIDKVSPDIIQSSNVEIPDKIYEKKVDVVEIDDDDVVLVEEEKKCEVIVLDD